MNFAFPEDLWALPSPAVLVGAVLVALLCGAPVLLGRTLRKADERDRGLRSDLEAERAYAEKATALVSGFVPVLSVLELEGVLRWTAETARELLGAPYAHAVVLDGSRHQTAAGRQGDAYPSWWHPTVQRLALRACRENGVARSGEVVHGMGGFVAVPMAPAGGERSGAIVVGGGSLGPPEERALGLLADHAGHALRSAEAAPGGRDPASGLPNRASLRRFLRGEFSRGGAPAVLVIGLRGLARHDRADDAAKAEFLRTLARELQGNRRRVFRHGEEELAVALGTPHGAKAYEAALGARRVAAELAQDAGLALTASVGFAAAEPEGDDGADELLGGTLEALGRAEGLPGGVAGSPAPGGREAAVDPGGLGGAVRPAEAVLALVAAAEARDPHLGGHSRSVARTARRIGAEMGLAPGQMDALFAGAMLHDVGKIGLPDRVLLKPGSLDTEEYEVVKRHPEIGAGIVGSIGGLSSALPVVRHHHERFDGEGYPDGLRSAEIPLLARIVFVADALDSMVSDRAYRRGIPEREALDEIARNSGTQFDPEVVAALMDAVEEPRARRTDAAG